VSRESIRARLAAATPGPWKASLEVAAAHVARLGQWEVSAPKFIGGKVRQDATLIAHAPSDLAALLAVADAVESGDFVFPTPTDDQSGWVYCRPEFARRILAARQALREMP
jgi:hypothetical protein